MQHDLLMVYLRSISLKPDRGRSKEFPFNLPFVRAMKTIEFRSPVTILVGENGSGKSTLLEAIAAGLGAATVGGDEVEADQTLEHARRFAKKLRFAWAKRSHRGFFLRAEDFFNFARRLQRMKQEFDEMAAGYEQRMSGYGLMLAKGAVLGQKAAITAKYGENLDANSHGESFLKLFQARFVPGGLYLLDEPEAPLSPLRQLSLLSMLKEMVAKDGQFIIATHSPILMAFPGATILSFDTCPVKEVKYEELEHVTLTKAFLNNPENYLRRL